MTKSGAGDDQPEGNMQMSCMMKEFVDSQNKELITNSREMTGRKGASSTEQQRVSVDHPPPPPRSDSWGDHEESNEESPVVDVVVGPKHFELLKLVGEGAFGKVLLVRNRLNQRKYAMKVISKKLIKKKNHIHYMRSERAILTKVVHPFVVSLKFAFQSETKLFLVMNFLGGGELFYHLKRRGLIREHEARFYAAEMILAIEFLHDMGIVHRDLKPENVLLDRDGHVALTDFGLAKEIGEGSDVRTLCGTSEYMAPEMLVRNGYGKAVDWWSLGALLFEMLAGSPPFTASKGGGQKELDRKIISERLSCPPHLTAPAHSLLKRLLEKDPSKRLGCAKSTMFCIGGVTALKNHEFFLDIDWECLLHKDHGDPPIDVNVVTADGQENDTSHFHEGFTSQCLSPSVVDDSLTPGMHTPSSTGPTTPCRSRGNSFERAFDDFSYSEPGELVVTQRQLEQFEVALQDKIRSQQKKRAKRAKGEEARAARVAAEQMQAALLAAQKEQEEQARKQQRALASLRERQRRAVDKSKRELEMQRAQFEAASCEASAAQEGFEDRKKKVKRLTKKLKEILALVDKEAVGTLSAEQRQKLGRRQEVEDDLVEAEEQEEEAGEALGVCRKTEKAQCEALAALEKRLEVLRLEHEQQVVEIGGEVMSASSGASTSQDSVEIDVRACCSTNAEVPEPVSTTGVWGRGGNSSSIPGRVEKSNVVVKSEKDEAVPEKKVEVPRPQAEEGQAEEWETVSPSRKGQKKKKNQ